MQKTTPTTRSGCLGPSRLAVGSGIISCPEAPVAERRQPSRRSFRFTFTSIVIATAALSISNPMADAAERPMVLLVTVDTLRADRLSSYGYQRPTSPNIDELLNRGVRFSRARTPEPLTNPALSSMVTGVPPEVHGATRNGLRIREGLDSLPKILARNGWTTAAIVSNWTLKDNVSGLAEHFDEYIGVFTRKRWYGLLNSEATGRDVTDRAIDWIDNYQKEGGGRPFMLWVHYVEPHAPYVFQRKHADRLGIDRRNPSRSDRYDTEIVEVDSQIGRLLDRVTETIDQRKMLVFFAADHGESLGEHGFWGHGRNLHEPGLAIPMGLTWVGRIVRRVVDAPAALHDLGPTVLELLDIDVPEAFTGASWADVLTAGRPANMDRGICYQAHKGAVHGDHDSDRARSKGVISFGFVHNERKEILRVADKAHMIFDLVRDPLELDNLVAADSEPSPELLQCVGTISEGLGALDRIATRKLSDEDVERLRALGYLD
jgi:arylsulfatase A-like enzyme